MEVINFKKSWSISSLKSAGHLTENKLHAYVVLSIKKSLNFALFIVIVKTKINWDCKNFFSPANKSGDDYLTFAQTFPSL